jgi:hypothetical protein
MARERCLFNLDVESIGGFIAEGRLPGPLVDCADLLIAGAGRLDLPLVDAARADEAAGGLVVSVFYDGQA